MNQIEAAVGEYDKTIRDISMRLANAAAQIYMLMDQLEAKSKELEALKSRDEPKPPEANVA